MDIVQLSIPYGFASERADLNWRDINFGLKNQLLDPDAPKQLALAQSWREDEQSSAILEIAKGAGFARTAVLVEQLAASEAQSDEDCRAKWLYLVLAWIYENRGTIADPLQRVEEVYGDFDYPARIASFVRYMPMKGPDLGSREANEKRLFERWRQYLDEAESHYKKGIL